jgi:site-specific DNA-methyltransferase (adenine-specific)
VKEAKQLYVTNDRSKQLDLDTVHYTDCISGMGTFPEDCIDLVIADPPFGIDFDGKSAVYNRDEGLVVEGYEEVQGSYAEFTEAWLRQVARVLKKDGSAYVFSGWNNLEAVLTGARKAGLSILNHIIWSYPFGVFTKRKFVTSHYHVLLLVADSDNYFFNKIENYPEDVWRINRRYRPGEVKNSTKLPLELISRCIDYSSCPGEIVLDPFMGNGTTAVAAKSSWRHFIGFELNERLKPVIESEVAQVKVGELYRPYTKRLPSVKELKELYPRAYQEYLKRGGAKFLGE